MKCIDCVFYYKDKYDRFPSCHFVPITLWDSAPCEYEDNLVDEEDDYPCDEVMY